MPQQDFVFVFDCDHTVQPGVALEVLGGKIREATGEVENRVFYVPFPDLHAKVTYETLLEARLTSLLSEMDGDGVGPKPIGIGFGLGAIHLLRAASRRDFGKIVLVCPAGFYRQSSLGFLMRRLKEEVIVERTRESSKRYLWPFWQRVAEAQLAIADFSDLCQQLIQGGVQIYGIYGEHDYMFRKEQLQKAFYRLRIPSAQMPSAGHYLKSPLWLAEQLKKFEVY